MTLTLNREALSVDVDPRMTLLRFLRDYRGLTGTKDGCSRGQCGTCTVLVDGRAQRACLLVMGKLEGASILTIEGLAAPGELTYVQRAFVEEGAVQCGFCTPGMVMAATALLDAVDDPHRRPDSARLEKQPVPVHRLWRHSEGRPARGSGPLAAPAGRGLGIAGRDLSGSQRRAGQGQG